MCTPGDPAVGSSYLLFYYAVSDLFFHLFIFCMFVFFCSSRLTTHYTSEYEIHVDKRWCGIHGMRGDWRPTDTHIVDQRIRPTELQKRQSQVNNPLLDILLSL